MRNLAGRALSERLALTYPATGDPLDADATALFIGHESLSRCTFREKVAQ